MALKRGEVYWINFDPSVGEEIRKIRPAVGVSNDVANEVLNRFLVIPLTSQTKNVYPGEALVQLRNQTSKAMADQLTTVSKLRFKSRIGSLTESEMLTIDKVLLHQLGIRFTGKHL